MAGTKSQRQWTRDPGFALDMAGEVAQHIARVEADANGNATDAQHRIRLIKLKRFKRMLENNATAKLDKEEGDEE